MERYRLTSRRLSVPERGQSLFGRASTRSSANTFRSWPEQTIRNGVLKNSGVFREPAIRAVGASIATKSMNARSFFDSNILVYADDKRAPAKQSRAIDLVAEHRRDRRGVISLQVLHEYFVTRKRNVDSPLARRKVEILSEFDAVVPAVADILATMDLHRSHAFSFWDALVLRSAQPAGGSHPNCPRIFRKAVKSMGFSS
jgi:predicted nucleic acid-binding protein